MLFKARYIMPVVFLSAGVTCQKEVSVPHWGRDESDSPGPITTIVISITDFSHANQHHHRRRLSLYTNHGAARHNKQEKEIYVSELESFN
jgi:hypothetical protein